MTPLTMDQLWTAIVAFDTPDEARRDLYVEFVERWRAGERP